MKALIVGGGVMGEIIARSLLERNVLEKNQLSIIEVSPDRISILKERYAINVHDQVSKEISEADLIIFSVKPQSALETLGPLCEKIKSDALVISIMAGVKLESIQKALKHRSVVRAMPNIPAQIGEGMTVWLADKNVSDLQLLLAKMVFQAFGKEVCVNNDDMIDAATAVSGSGPAYIFYVAEKLILAAKNLGFSPEESEKLARQTFHGAMNMWEKTRENPEKLRLMVTSKKGTTEAAITKFDELKTENIFNESIKSAYKRAKELGEEMSSKFN